MGSELSKDQVVIALECIECAAASVEGRGWKAYLYEESQEVYVYCPACAQREFGADQ